jgi:purine-binding chemotaxis protein CheW
VAPHRLLTFRAGGRTQAIAADAVREVVRVPRLTPVPHAPDALVGIGNVRGSAVPILSVGRLQGQSSLGTGTILVLDRSPPVGLLVDEVRAIEDAKRGAKRLDIETLLAQAYRNAPVANAARRIAQVAAQPKPARSSSAVRLILFQVADQRFALPLEQVAEIVRLPADIATVPHADRAVAGTSLHRGSVLPLFHLDVLLNLTGSRHPVSRKSVVIARIRGRRVGLLVDRMGSIIGLDPGAIDPVPAVIARRLGEAKIQAIGRLENAQGLVSILATDHLLDEQLIAQLDESETEAERMAPEQREAFLLFRLGDESFGLPASAVEEIVRIPDALVRVPRAPDFIEGIISLRGHAVPVIDQRRRFGATPAGTAGKRAILLNIGALRACFVVDRIDEVRSIGLSAITSAPDMGDGPKLFDRIASLDDGARIVLLIEPGQLLDGAEKDLLTALAKRTKPATA